MKPGMWNYQTGSVDLQIVVHKKVDIDHSVPVDAVYRLPAPAQLFLNALNRQKQTIRIHIANHFANGIYKIVARIKPFGRGCIKSGSDSNRSNPLGYFLIGGIYVLFLIAQVGAKSQKNTMFRHPPINPLSTWHRHKRRNDTLL